MRCFRSVPERETLWTKQRKRNQKILVFGLTVLKGSSSGTVSEHALVMMMAHFSISRRGFHFLLFSEGWETVGTAVGVPPDFGPLLTAYHVLVLQCLM